MTGEIEHRQRLPPLPSGSPRTTSTPPGRSARGCSRSTTSGSPSSTCSASRSSFSSAAPRPVLIRLELMTPQGDLVEAETYNKLFTLHGIIMVFFFLIPSIPGGAGQFPHADDDRRPGPGVSQAQSAELVSLHDRRAVHAVASSSPAASTRAGRSTRRTAAPIQQHLRHRRRRSASSSPASRRS